MNTQKRCTPYYYQETKSEPIRTFPKKCSDSKIAKRGEGRREGRRKKGEGRDTQIRREYEDKN